jgi:hypothetical protein
MKKYEQRKPSTNWEKAVLSYNPFEGDFGDQTDVTFKDRLVVSRSEYTCHWCQGIINKGARYRYIAAKFDGALCYYKFCSSCCKAMARSWTDNGEAVQKQFDKRNDSVKAR